MSYSLNKLNTIAGTLLSKHGNCRFWFLDGDLGVGKTAMVKALCSRLGVQEEVSSPTFTIVNLYHGAGGIVVSHVDLYRIESDAELCALDLGYYFDASRYCFVEWASKHMCVLQSLKPRVQLSIKSGEGLFSRNIDCSCVD